MARCPSTSPSTHAIGSATPTITTLVRFLDLFHHRALALFYRGWANAQPTVQRDRPSSDRFVTYLGALFGIGSPGPARPRRLSRQRQALLRRTPRPPRAQRRGTARHHRRLFPACPPTSRSSSASGPRSWTSERWRITRTAFAGALGISTILGARAWQRQTKFRIVFGPLKEDQFQSILPGSRRLRVLKALVRNYVGDSLNWDVRLFLDKRVSQPFRLDRITRLGWTSWLGHCPEGEGREDLIINPHAETTSDPTQAVA